MNSCNVNISDPFVTKKTINPYSDGILNGLSFAIKDNIDIKNQTTGYGSPGWVETHYKPVVNAISCLSCTPQITIPIVEDNGVPVGLSFIAGYGQDMVLIDLCNKLYNQCSSNF